MTDEETREHAEETIRLIHSGHYNVFRPSNIILRELVEVVGLLADDLAELKGEGK